MAQRDNDQDRSREEATRAALAARGIHMSGRVVHGDKHETHYPDGSSQTYYTDRRDTDEDCA